MARRKRRNCARSATFLEAAATYFAKESQRSLVSSRRRKWPSPSSRCARCSASLEAHRTSDARKGLEGAQKRKFHCTTDSRHTLPIAPNRLDRNFDPTEANRVWAGDVTYIAIEQGWPYLAVILDLFSRRVVGWSVSPTTDTKLAQEALRRELIARRPELGLLHHTDHGSSCASLAYTSILRQYGVVASMSRAADCYDNAVVESFFGTLKAELVRGCVYPSRVVATAAIRDYIENFYNPQRRHSHLQYLSPIEFELRSQTAAFAA
jgi:putative transposase